MANNNAGHQDPPHVPDPPPDGDQAVNDAAVREAQAGQAQRTKGARRVGLVVVLLCLLGGGSLWLKPWNWLDDGPPTPPQQGATVPPTNKPAEPTICKQADEAERLRCRAGGTATPTTPQAPTPAPAATKVRVLSRVCNEAVVFDFTQVRERVVNDHGCVLQSIVVTGKVKAKVEYCTSAQGKKVRCTAWDDKTKTIQWWEVGPNQEIYLVDLNVLEFAYGDVPGGVAFKASPFK